MADILLHEWENRALKPHTAAYVTARPLAVAELAALLGTLVFRRPGDLALDLEDVRDALRRAQSFGTGCTTARRPPGRPCCCTSAATPPPNWKWTS